MYAIISDIHANYDALTEVFKDIDQHQVSSVVCLGDIVGYGPEPEKCIDLIEERCRFVLCGNHDFALINGPYGFSHIAKEALECTRQRMLPQCYDLVGNKKHRWEFMGQLPDRREEGDVLYVHASPREPVFEYLFCDKSPMFSQEDLDENFRLVKRLCFVGHTHHPAVILDDFQCIYPENDRYTYKFPQGQKAIVNVGSVGQPRDHDNRACYVLVDDDAVTYRRIPYDIESVIEKIAKIGCINKRCGLRLRDGM